MSLKNNVINIPFMVENNVFIIVATIVTVSTLVIPIIIIYIGICTMAQARTCSTERDFSNTSARRHGAAECSPCQNPQMTASREWSRTFASSGA